MALIHESRGQRSRGPVGSIRAKGWPRQFCAFNITREGEAGRTLRYHGSTGKVRTDFATLLLLSALDATPEAILATYLE